MFVYLGRTYMARRQVPPPPGPFCLDLRIGITMARAVVWMITRIGYHILS